MRGEDGESESKVKERDRGKNKNKIVKTALKVRTSRAHAERM